MPCLQAVVTGAPQGVTELFPVSSLGHSALPPARIGGSWHHLVTENATGNSEGSPHPAFIVALPVATAAKGHVPWFPQFREGSGGLPHPWHHSGLRIAP
ncbi:hypothetical protein [Streptomyces shenzhenensis]|uniref:hypothetical protein n=1 Tax=Streptomyces shenzhenensis TaxID=943815 RepID=UPI001F45DB96|nr:hypothetical protein [Streptomyces shenzhenensis]